MLTVTEAGRAAFARDLAQRDDWLAAAMSGLTEIERQLLVLASGLVLRLADAPGTAPASGDAATRDLLVHSAQRTPTPTHHGRPGG